MLDEGVAHRMLLEILPTREAEFDLLTEVPSTGKLHHNQHPVTILEVFNIANNGEMVARCKAVDFRFDVREVLRRHLPHIQLLCDEQGSVRYTPNHPGLPK